MLHGPIGPLPRLTDRDAAMLPDYALRHGMVAFLPRVLPALPDLPPGVRDGVEQEVREHAVSVLRNTSDLLTIAALCAMELRRRRLRSAPSRS